MASSLQWTEHPWRRYSGVEKFPVPLPELRDCPAGEISVGDIRQVPGVLLNFGCSPSETDCRPSVGCISRSDIRQAQPHSSTSSRGRRATHARPGSVLPRRIAETKKPPPTNRGRRRCRGYPGSAPRGVLAQFGEMRGQAVEFRPLPFRQMAHGRLGQAHLADEAPAMPAHEQVAAHRQLSAEVQLPIEKVAGPGDQFLQLSIGRSPRNAPGWRRPSGGRDAAAPGHWKA